MVRDINDPIVTGFGSGLPTDSKFNFQHDAYDIQITK